MYRRVHIFKINRQIYYLNKQKLENKHLYSITNVYCRIADLKTDDDLPLRTDFNIIAFEVYYFIDNWNIIVLRIKFSGGRSAAADSVVADRFRIRNLQIL